MTWGSARLIGWNAEVFPKEEHRAIVGDAGQFAEHAITQTLIKRSRLKTGSFQISQLVAGPRCILFNRGEQG